MPDARRAPTSGSRRLLSALACGLTLAVNTFLAAPGRADDCPDPLFVCQTDREGKYVQVCAVQEDVGQRWSHIQYRFGKENEKPELVFPRDASKQPPPLLFSHEVVGAEYRVSLRFASGGYTYRIFSHADDRGDGQAGVTISDSKGKVVSTVRCIERSHMFPAYLQRALPCDLKNPHGKAACGEAPYEPLR